MLSPGTRLGPYEILDSLGAGGMGHVYRARDTRLGRLVAVKVLPEEFRARPESLARFEREGLAVAALSHPNILAIHDVGTTADGTAYAVTELLEGESLREALRDGALPLRRATDFAIQLARGLAAAHDKGIVHRDLKPENLFITRDGRLKILDFGLARQDAPSSIGSETVAPTIHSPTDPGTVLGTVGYMAPEQVRGATVDHRADIFSFGCVLFEMVTGRRAFQRETAAETMTAILKDDAPDTGTDQRLPPALDRIIRLCLEKVPDARFRSAHDLALALEATSGVSGSSASAVSPATASLSPARNTRTRAALIVTAFLLILAAAGGFWFGRLASTGTDGSVPLQAPVFRRVTFNPAQIEAARFTPDGHTFVYDARVAGAAPRLMLTRLESPGTSTLSVPNAVLFSVSKDAEVLAGVNPVGLYPKRSMLVRMPLLGGAPRQVLENVTFADWSPVDEAIAAVHQVGSEQRLEFPIGTVLFTTEGEIGFPRISPQGDRVAFFDWPVKNDDRGTLVIVDRQGNRQTVSHAWDAARGIAWSPSGNEVWYTATVGGRDNSVWSSAVGRPERRIYSAPVSLVLQDIAKDGKVLMARYDRPIHVEGVVAGETSIRDLSWLGRSFARDFSPDGRVLLSYFGPGSSTNYDVYVRDVHEPEATRVGEGLGQQFSPDGKSVLAVQHGPPARLVILPIGPGQAKTIATGNVTVTQARWLPDARHVLAIGTEPTRGERAYVMDVAGAAPRPVTPEGITFLVDSVALSHDGRRVAFRSPDGVVMLYSTEDLNPNPVKGLADAELPNGWTADDRLLTVLEGTPARRVVGVEPTTGRRETLKTFEPSDASLIGPTQVFLSLDRKSYVANYTQQQMVLFVAEGLR